MDERFPYGYDVQVYLDKAFEQLKETMFWATKEMLDDRYVYTIEQENGVYNFVSYYKQDDGGTQRSVLDYCDWKGFIDHWVSGSMSWETFLCMCKQVTARQERRKLTTFHGITSNYLGRNFWISTSIWSPQALAM